MALTLTLERQREGIAKAKSEGRYKGRKPIETERRNNVFKLAAEGFTRAAIATQLGVGEATVYRILASAKSKTANRSFRPIVPKTPVLHLFAILQT